MTECKTIIITGSGSGIGKAAALRFAKDGHNVVLNGRTLDKLEAVRDEIGRDDQVLICQGDVSDNEAVNRMTEETINRFGAIGVVVNNAGIAIPDDFESSSHNDFDTIINVNVKGVYNVSKSTLPHLKTAKGNIINVSSVSGLGGDWGMCIYNTSKGAVSNMTRAMALDLAKDGIRVNAVAPSLTSTEMTSGMKDNDSLIKKFEERIPMARAAQPDEVADVIAFLASYDARFVTGTIIPVDGGLSASNGQPPLG